MRKRLLGDPVRGGPGLIAKAAVTMLKLGCTYGASSAPHADSRRLALSLARLEVTAEALAKHEDSQSAPPLELCALARSGCGFPAGACVYP